MSGWVVIKYGPVLFFSSNVFLAFIAGMLLVFTTRQLGDFKNVGLNYWKHRTMGAVGWISWFLSLIIIKDLGLSISILLGFVGVGVTLLFSYLFLGDKPSKKNILLTVIISMLIGIGYYFK